MRFDLGEPVACTGTEEEPVSGVPTPIRPKAIRSATAVLAAAAVFFVGACSSSSDDAAAATGSSIAASATPARVAGAVTISGAVAEQMTVSLADLRAYPAQTQQVSYEGAGKHQEHTYVGASVFDILTAAKPQIDQTAKNGIIRLAVLGTASDGYQAAFSWGEFEPGFHNTPILIAYTEDGQDLQAPRLVVPGDARGGRYLDDVSNLDVVDLSK